MLERGRFTLAEATLRSALHEKGPAAFEARQMLAWLLIWQGRTDEARVLLEDGWDDAPDQAALLRELWQIDREFVLPIESIRDGLERASRMAPQDDRAWLGRGHLLTLSGEFEEADRWLKACITSRPNDVAVWRVRLNWAVSAGRPDEARHALARLAAGRASPHEVLSLRAWFAARRGDCDAERTALMQLVSLSPSDTRALDRLAAIAADAGRLPGCDRIPPPRRRRRADQGEVSSAPGRARSRRVCLGSGPAGGATGTSLRGLGLVDTGRSARSRPSCIPAGRRPRPAARAGRPAHGRFHVRPDALRTGATGRSACIAGDHRRVIAADRRAAAVPRRRLHLQARVRLRQRQVRAPPASRDDGGRDRSARL